MTTRHSDLLESGRIPHSVIEARLPTDAEKTILALVGRSAPVTVSGARDDPEQALANLLDALQTLGLITDTTTPT